MKKVLLSLLIAFVCLSLAGCSSSGENINQKEENDIEKQEEQIAGGFNEVEDGTITDELQEIFDTALEGLMGASYMAEELVATQVVAGTNYKFLASGTKTTNPITRGKYYITINKDLKGNISLLNIETIEESQDNN